MRYLVILTLLLISSNTTEETVTDFKVEREKSYISIEYFQRHLQCVPSCGVAVIGWENAKKYCRDRNSVLLSKFQIKESIGKKTDACLDCNYWTSTESNLKKGERINEEQKKEVYIYLNFEDHLLTYPIDKTYIARCLSD